MVLDNFHHFEGKRYFFKDPMRVYLRYLLTVHGQQSTYVQER